MNHIMFRESLAGNKFINENVQLILLNTKYNNYYIRYNLALNPSINKNIQLTLIESFGWVLAQNKSIDKEIQLLLFKRKCLFHSPIKYCLMKNPNVNWKIRIKCFFD